jgi:hypothetical protein
VPLIELATGSAGALIVAAQLGPWTILLTSAQLAAAVATCAGRSGWANASLAVALPLTVAWLFGSTLSGALAPASVLVSVSFGLSTSSALSVARSGHGLLWQAAPQVVALCCLLWIGQPLAAAGMGLLCVAQVLWAPLLPEPGSRAAYFRSLQLPWAAAMLLAAWALGTAQ